MKRALIFWFTGLSGAGKSSVAEDVRVRLERNNFSVKVLDGDDVRNNIHTNLGFSDEDIIQNNALIVDLCKSLREDCNVILVPIISPFSECRQAARSKLSPGFYEVYFDADLACVLSRDVKGLYSLARRGEINNMIGYSPGSVYDPPISPDFLVPTGAESFETCTMGLYKFTLCKLRKVGQDHDYQT